VSDGRMIEHNRRMYGRGIKYMITTPDSKYLFAVDKHDDNLKQICIETQKVVHDYGANFGGSITFLQTTRDSKYVITGSWAGHVKKISIENRAVEKDFYGFFFAGSQ
jgi:hypothetical protein